LKADRTDKLFGSLENSHWLWDILLFLWVYFKDLWALYAPLISLREEVSERGYSQHNNYFQYLLTISEQ